MGKGMPDVCPWFPSSICDDCGAQQATDYIGDILCDECFRKQWEKEQATQQQKEEND